MAEQGCISLAKDWIVVRLSENDANYYYIALSPDSSLYFAKGNDAELADEDKIFRDCKHTIATFTRGAGSDDINTYDGIVEFKDGRIDVYFKHGIEHLEKVSSIPIELSPIIIKCINEMREELRAYFKKRENDIMVALKELSKSREEVRERSKRMTRTGFNPSGTYDYNVIKTTQYIDLICDHKEITFTKRLFCKVLETASTSRRIHDRVKHDVVVMKSSCFYDTHCCVGDNFPRYLNYEEPIQVNSRFAIIIIDKPLHKVEVNMAKCDKDTWQLPYNSTWANTWILVRDYTLNMALRSAVFIVGAKSSELITTFPERIYYSPLRYDGGNYCGGLNEIPSIPGSAEDDGYMVSRNVSPADVTSDPCAAFQHLLEEFNLV